VGAGGPPALKNDTREQPSLYAERAELVSYNIAVKQQGKALTSDTKGETTGDEAWEVGHNAHLS
jgi:hypothetical protein